MKKLFLLVLLNFLITDVMAQKLTAKEWESIQTNNQYIIGMGVATSIDNARQAALSDLAGKISVRVSSQFDYLIENKNKDNIINSEEKMKGIIKSYSSVTLNNVVSDRGIYQGCWVGRNSIHI